MLTNSQVAIITAQIDRVSVRNTRDAVMELTRGDAFVSVERYVADTGFFLQFRDEREPTEKNAPLRAGLTRVRCDTFEQAAAIAIRCLATGRTKMYGPGIGLRDFLPLHTSPPVNESWETIVQKVYGDCSGEEVYDLSADYQRPAVWTAEQMSSFVGFAMTGGTVPTVYCRRIESVENRKTEVVDGKQRIRAICAFIKGHIPASFIHRGKCHEVWWMALDEIDRRCRTLDLSVSYNNWSRVQAMDFYVRLNGAGTPHTPEELERVRNLLLAEEG